MEEYIIVNKPIRRCGVYAILNLCKRKVYIGESKDLYHRIGNHFDNIFREIRDNGTNNNLIDEKCKTYEILPVIYAENYDKESLDFARHSDWIIDETLCMYVFRCIGFDLYNGSDDVDKRDNVGRERDFLFDNNLSVKEMYNGLVRFLGKEWTENNIKDVLDNVARKINENIGCLGVKLEDLEYTNNDTLRQLWKKRVNNLLDKIKGKKIWHEVAGIKTYIINDGNYDLARKVLNDLIKERLKKQDLLECGVGKKTIQDLKELYKNGELDRIGICKFGHYLDQSPVTILRTKVYDIQHSSMDYVDGELMIRKKENDAEKGICFWSLKKFNIEEIRNFFDAETRSSKYILMPYTTSDVYKNSQSYYGNKEEINQKELNFFDNEEIDDFYFRMKNKCIDLEKKITDYVKIEDSENKFDRFAEDKFSFGYALDQELKKYTKKYKYPLETMFPEVISKWSINKDKGTVRKSLSVALLISELSFVDADIEISDLFDCYISHTGNQVKDTIKGQNGTCRASVNDQEEISNFFDELKSKEVLTDESEVGFLIAKVEYPYVVRMLEDPFDYN